MATLLLRFAGALQSWGIESKFEERRSMNFPTKSGTIGLVAAALGRARTESLADLNELKFGIRVDQEGELLRDFHTAKPEKDKGKGKEKDSYITNRYYLADAIFLVGLESDDTKFLAQIEEALKNPAFPLFLGRRSCPPTQPLVLGIRNEDLLSALQNEPWLMAPWRQKRLSFNRDYYEDKSKLRIIIDDENGDAVLRDLPLSFDRNNRSFTWRRVREVDRVNIAPTEHDPMVELG